MKLPRNYDKSVTLEALAEGHCNSVGNARRLIDDGEILIKCERYLGAINSFMLATEELAKAHLIDQTIAFSHNDKKKWKWFWNAFPKHKEKIRLLNYSFHWKSNHDKEEFGKKVNYLMSKRLESIYVDFDTKDEKFLSPEEVFSTGIDIKDCAIIEQKYALVLFNMFIIAGMPTPEIKLKAYKLYRKTEKID